MAGFELQSAIITVLALALFIISILAYKKERTWRLLVTSVVFVLFLIKGIIMTISIFTNNLDDFASDLTFHLTLDLVILLFLFISVLAPPKTRKESKTMVEEKDEENSQGEP
jgi:hypothetical protein